MQSIHFQSLINALVSTHPIASHLRLNWGMVSFASHRKTTSNEGITMAPMKRYAKKQAKANKRRRLKTQQRLRQQRADAQRYVEAIHQALEDWGFPDMLVAAIEERLH